MSTQNDRRADRVYMALVTYKGSDAGAPDGPEMVIDFLTDLHHLMARNGDQDPKGLLDSLLVSSHSHFESESERQRFQQEDYSTKPKARE